MLGVFLHFEADADGPVKGKLQRIDGRGAGLVAIDLAALFGYAPFRQQTVLTAASPFIRGEFPLAITKITGTPPSAYRLVVDGNRDVGWPILLEGRRFGAKLRADAQLIKGRSGRHRVRKIIFDIS